MLLTAACLNVKHSLLSKMNHCSVGRVCCARDVRSGSPEESIFPFPKVCAMLLRSVALRLTSESTDTDDWWWFLWRSGLHTTPASGECKRSSLEGADECRCHCQDWNIYLGTEGDGKSKDRIYFEVVMKYIRARNIAFGASRAITLADADARH